MVLLQAQLLLLFVGDFLNGGHLGSPRGGMHWGERTFGGIRVFEPISDTLDSVGAL